MSHNLYALSLKILSLDHSTSYMGGWSFLSESIIFITSLSGRDRIFKFTCLSKIKFFLAENCVNIARRILGILEKTTTS